MNAFCSQYQMFFSSQSLKFMSKEKKKFSIADKQIIRSKLSLKLDYIFLQEALYLKNYKIIAGKKR